jgi:NADPH:quinone reductase-like Zn-dependent oxidoreductase
MKAVVQNEYGSPLTLKMKEVPKPDVRENEVLVKVHASSVNAGDLFTVKGTPYMVRFMVGFKPKDFILGWDYAGRIEEVGGNVKDLNIGDEVYGFCESAFAEYVKINVDKIVKKPAKLSFGEAAAVPTGAITALQQLRDGGKIKKGQKVLITGASGGVGSFAVQIAKSFGTEVTGVCSTEKVEMVRSIGADHVIDYKKENFTKLDERYDLILDNSGAYKISEMKKVLKPKGKLVPNSGHGGMSYVIRSFFSSMFSSKVAGMKVAELNIKDFIFLNDLLETGKIRPFVDSVYDLERTPEALAHLDSGKVKGKIIIKVAEG